MTVADHYYHCVGLACGHKRNFTFDHELNIGAMFGDRCNFCGEDVVFVVKTDLDKLEKRVKDKNEKDI